MAFYVVLFLRDYFIAYWTGCFVFIWNKKVIIRPPFLKTSALFSYFTLSIVRLGNRYFTTFQLSSKISPVIYITLAASREFRNAKFLSSYANSVFAQKLYRNADYNATRESLSSF